MKEKTLKFLEAHESHEASTFVEEAKWRQKNDSLKRIPISLYNYRSKAVQ